MTPTQSKAVERFRAFLNREIARYVEKYGAEVRDFRVNENEYFISVTARTEYMGLPAGNVLRALDCKFWHVFIGKRGGIQVITCPDEFKQFAGRRAFGMKFRCDV